MDPLQKIIPGQEQGAASDTVADIECPDEDAARVFYQVAKQRLLNVNEWESLAGLTSANFTLCDAAGKEVDRPARYQDHFKIDVPGPGPLSGNGYDWVQIEDVEEKDLGEREFIAMTVRPVTDPTNDEPDVAHFFSDSATSSFVVERKGNVVSAAVHSRNEKPNAETRKIIDKARNSAMATAAITAFSKLQWKGLVEGIVKDK